MSKSKVLLTVGDSAKDRMRVSPVEKRVPMMKIVRDENGKTVEVPMGPEYYTIERPGGCGCLMSRAALESLMEK